MPECTTDRFHGIHPTIKTNILKCHLACTAQVQPNSLCANSTCVKPTKMNNYHRTTDRWPKGENKHEVN